MPPGEAVITRYDWGRHLTVPVGLCADRGSADAELERLKVEEVALGALARADGRAITRPHHYAIVKRS